VKRFLLADGFPRLHDVGRLAGLSGGEPSRAGTRGSRCRVHASEAEGRRGTSRRILRRAPRGPPKRSGPTTGCRSMPTRPGAVEQAIEAIGRLSVVDPFWIEEPTSPDDVVGPRADSQGSGAGTRCHGRARAEPRRLQNSSSSWTRIGRLPTSTAGRLGRSPTRCWRFSCSPRKFGVPVWPGTPAASGCASTPSTYRCSTTIAGRRIARGSGVRVRRPPTRALRSSRSMSSAGAIQGAPSPPGYSIEIKPCVAVRVRVSPDGAGWWQQVRHTREEGGAGMNGRHERRAHG